KLSRTVRVPRLFSSPKPPPVVPEKLLATVQLVRETAPLPALPRAPVRPLRAVLPVTTTPFMVRLALSLSLTSRQTAAPWLTQVLPLSTLPGLMNTLPLPTVLMPPPASPAWLLLIVLLLTVSVQGALTSLSIATPAPAPALTLLVRTMLVRVRLAL